MIRSYKNKSPAPSENRDRLPKIAKVRSTQESNLARSDRNLLLCRLRYHRCHLLTGMFSLTIKLLHWPP